MIIFIYLFINLFILDLFICVFYIFNHIIMIMIIYILRLFSDISTILYLQLYLSTVSLSDDCFLQNHRQCSIILP